MARDFGYEISRIRTAKELLEFVKSLKSEGLEVNDFPILRLVLESLGVDADWPTRIIINKLESLGDTEINPDQFAAKAEEQLEQGVVPMAQIKQLLEDYEEYLEGEESGETALSKLIEQYNGRISRNQIEILIRRQEKIYQEAVEKLMERKAEATLGKEGMEQAARTMAKEVIVMEEETGGMIPPDVAKEVVGQIRGAVLTEAVEVVLEREVGPGGLERRIEEAMKRVEPEKVKTVLREAVKIPSLTVASLKMEAAVEEITERVMGELESAEALGPTIVGENREKLRLAVENKIVEAIKEKRVRLELPSEKIEGLVKERAQLVIKKAEEAVRIYKTDNAGLIKILETKGWEEGIETRMAADRPPKTEWIRRIIAIKQYEEMVEEMFSPMAGVRLAEEEEWSEANTWWRVMNAKPDDFNEVVKKYWLIRNEVNIPSDDPKGMAIEKVMRMAKDEEARGLINAAQRMTGVRRWLDKIGIKNDFGAERFLKSLGELGTGDGGLAAIRSFVGGGTSGKLLQFFGGMKGPLGWLGTGTTMGGRTIFGGLGGLVGKSGGLVGNLRGAGISGLKLLGGKLKAALPGILAKLGTAGATAAGGLLAIPSMITISAAAIGIVVVTVIVGLFAYSMRQSWQISSLVPPKGAGLLSGAYDPNAPGLEPEMIEGECSLANHVTGIKQNSGSWANKQLPGGCTFTESGCGPTSVAKITTRINSTLSPDYLVYETGSAYGSIGCDGSSMSQAKSTLEKYLGAEKISYDGVTRGCDKRDIGEWIKHGKIVMVLADFYSNAEASRVSGHYTLAVAVSGGEIMTSDAFYPNGPAFDGKREYGHVYKIRECLLIETGEGCL